VKHIIRIISISILLGACGTKTEKPVEKGPEAVSVKPAANAAENVDLKRARNIAFAENFYAEVVNKHNVAMIDSFASEDYIDHQYDTHFKGTRDGIKKAFADYFTAFPDMHVKANFFTCEGDIITAQITTTGTNTGPIYGRPGTKKKFEINGVDIIRLKNGKVVEHWGYAEEGKLLTQLGLIRPLMVAGRKGQKEIEKQLKKKESAGL